MNNNRSQRLYAFDDINKNDLMLIQFVLMTNSLGFCTKAI